MRRLVVVDDRDTYSLLKPGLAPVGFIVTLAGDGEQLLRLAREHAPRLVVLSGSAHGHGMLDLCRQLRLRDSDLMIVVLAARDCVAERVAALEAGADACLSYPVDPAELQARVRACLRRQEATRQTMFSFAGLRLETATNKASYGNQPLRLTGTEGDLLGLFLHFPGRILTRSFIQRAIWGYDCGGESKLLAVYVGYLREKLAAAGAPRLIHTVRGIGYVLRESPHEADRADLELHRCTG